jgi:hypothetical protein
MSSELDRQLQYGFGMRVQRLVEAAFLVGAFLSEDTRLAYVTFGFTMLQALSPRLVPVALVATWMGRPRVEHRLGDLYFDLAGTRGACAVSVVVQGGGLWLAEHGFPRLGYAILTVPAASFVLAPTVGFCCGCAAYVGLRAACARLGFVERYAHGAGDVDIEGTKSSGSE